jgi:uncharacterized membrane protein
MMKVQNMRNLMVERDKINTQKRVSNMKNLTNNKNMAEKVNKNSKTTKEQSMTKKQIMKKVRSFLSNFPKESLKKSQDSQIRRGL